MVTPIYSNGKPGKVQGGGKGSGGGREGGGRGEVKNLAWCSSELLH